jgi:hypothetical protein
MKYTNISIQNRCEGHKRVCATSLLVILRDKAVTMPFYVHNYVQTELNREKSASVFFMIFIVCLQRVIGVKRFFRFDKTSQFF